MSLSWLKVDAWLGLMGKFAAGWLFVVSLGLTACGTDPAKPDAGATPCTLDSECDGELVCSFGLCHQECADSGDCPANQRCVQGDVANVCQLNEEVKCTLKSQCEKPLVCGIDLQCRNECAEDIDCLKGQTCAAEKVCADPEEVNADGSLKLPPGFVPEPTGQGGMGNTPNGAGGAGGEGGSPVVTPTCVAGESCVSEENPCWLGSVVCTDGVPSCKVSIDADDGTECGADKVCRAGACVECAAGTACQPEEGNVCVSGLWSCALGPECVSEGNTDDGTACGAQMVCDGGVCVGCVPNQPCEPANPCKNGVTSCNNGVACAATTNKAAGDECGTDQVCNSSGTCVACVQGGTCSPFDNECHVGLMDCTAGPNCTDTQTAAEDGLVCTGSASFNFCVAGVCEACQDNNPCIPENPCHKGTLNCATSPPTCNDSLANADDGLVCGDNKSCISGACVTNDRTLTITSATPAAVAIDAPFTSVSVKLVDSNDQPLQGVQVSVTASPGAYAVGSAATGASGIAQISGRVGRAVGTYTYTVNAPGASGVQFTVDAVAPTSKHIYTLVNVNHLSGPATPGPGTISKLNNETNALVSAKDGTLYIASYCAVFKLSPEGVLTRIAGSDENNYYYYDCGFAGDSGAGTSALLSYVSALALDETNNYLYIADYNNYRVRQLNLENGTILTYAGSGSSGSNVEPWGNNGPADSAYLLPSNVSVAPNGDVYISDANSSHIRKVDFATGIITSHIADNGCNTNAPLHIYNCGGTGDPCGLAWNKDGKLFISAYLCGGGQSYFHGVARVEADKSLTLVAGTSGAANQAEGGAATSATFTYSPHITFDKAGNLFLSARGDHRVRRVDAANLHITTVAGTGTAAYAGEYVLGSTAQVNSPSQLSFDDAGNLYFADATNYAVRGLWAIGNTTAPTANLATLAGGGQSVTIDAPFTALTVKLTDGANAAISGVDVRWKRMETGSGLGASGATTTTGKTNAQGNSSMTGRVGLATGDYTFEASFTDLHGAHATGSPQTFTVAATAPAGGTIFPIVNFNHTGGLGGTPGPATYAKQYGGSRGVAAHSDGTIYTSDQCAVYAITPRGEISVFAGTPGSCGFAGDSGPAVGAQLYYPSGLTLDETNEVLYIADHQNQAIRGVSLTTGVIDLFAGRGDAAADPWGDGGPALDANIGYPESVTAGPDGKVYFPDVNHYPFRVVDPITGIISTWLNNLYPTGCTVGVPNLYYALGGSTVRFKSNGEAYIASYICTGVDANPTRGILHRATNGTLTHVAGLYSGTTTENADATATVFNDLQDIVIDPAGNLIVAMYGYHRVRKINMATGKINTIAGDGTAGYAAPADVSAEPGAYVAASGVRLYNPYRLAITAGGSLLISDYSNYTTRMIW